MVEGEKENFLRPSATEMRPLMLFVGSCLAKGLDGLTNVYASDTRAGPEISARLHHQLRRIYHIRLV